MLEFRQLELTDKLFYEGYTLCHGYHNLEASFANIYLWGNTMGIKMAADEKAMYLLIDNGETRFMLAPFLKECDTDYCEPMQKCEKIMLERYGKFLLKGVTAEQKEKIEADCAGMYEFIPDRDNFEYVYLSEDLITLQGSKYHAKRNHINKLLKSHEFEYRSYAPEYYKDCLALEREWVKNKEDYSKSYEQEYQVIKGALENLDTLGLKCGMLYVDGRMQAFSIGEKFGDDMAIIHIEKANPDIQGAYALINREFAKNEFSDVKYINREEDMGLEGLRKAKLSYNPAFLLEKYDCIKVE